MHGGASAAKGKSKAEDSVAEGGNGDPGSAQLKPTGGLTLNGDVSRTHEFGTSSAASSSQVTDSSASTSSTATTNGYAGNGPNTDSQQDSAAGPAEQENDTDDADQALLEHIYQRGFIGGEFADVALHYRPGLQPLRLHSLIVCTSPAIASLLQQPLQSQSLPGMRDVFMPIDDQSEVTNEAFLLAIGYLYSSRSLAHLTAEIAPAVLASAIMLQLPALAQHAGRSCRETIDSIVSPSQVIFWIGLLTRLDSRPNAAAAYWTNLLREGLMTRLASTLPSSLHAFSTQHAAQSQEAQSILCKAYSCLPFELFKAILESPSLGTGSGESLSDQARFALAKRCIAERKKDPSHSVQGDFEETVVLAFGGSSAGASNVNIVRRPKQNRRLWKVGGS